MQGWFTLANNPKQFDFMFYSVFTELRLPSLPAKFPMQLSSSCASPFHYRSSTRLQTAGWVILVLVPQTLQKRSQNPLPSWLHSSEEWYHVPPEWYSAEALTLTSEGMTHECRFKLGTWKAALILLLLRLWYWVESSESMGKCWKVWTLSIVRLNIKHWWLGL